MQTMPKMTRLENEMLSWLENELRERLHAQAEFSSKADAPIVLTATGKFVDKNCGWNKFLTSDKSYAFSEEVRNMPSNGIRSYVYKLCLNGAVSMETQEISNQHKLCMKTLFTEAFVSADQNLSLQDDDIDPELPASFQNDDQLPCSVFHFGNETRSVPRGFAAGCWPPMRAVPPPDTVCTRLALCRARIDCFPRILCSDASAPSDGGNILIGNPFTLTCP
jgi:hypothetical protein